MRTKVAIILPYFGAGGAEHMVARLASHLDLKKIDAEVICIYGSPLNNEMEKAVLAHGVNIHYIQKPLGFSIKAMFRVYKELNRFSPDVVHSHLSGGFYSTLWILFHSVKMIHTVHNMPMYEFGAIKRFVMSVLYKLGKAIPVGISNEISQMIKTTYHSKYGVELVYNPVDVQRFAMVKKEKHIGYQLVNVGRLDIQKNHRLLIKAFSSVVKHIPEARLWILGDGPLRNELKVYINNLGLNDSIILKGNVADVENYLAKADAFVLSSDYEGLPLSILEAMAAGLPVVATDVGGVKDIVTDNGILVPKGDCDKLAKAMIKIGQNNLLRCKYAKNSSVNAKQFDSDVIAKKYEGLYIKYGGYRNS